MADKNIIVDVLDNKGQTMRIKDLGAVKPGLQAQLDGMEKAAARWEGLHQQVENVRRDLAEGRVPELETKARRLKFAEREVTKLAPAMRVLSDEAVRLGLERKVLTTPDLLSIEFFEAGLQAGLSVGRIETPMEKGTGFLVGHDILLTNNHVLPSSDLAQGSSLELDAEENRYGTPKHQQVFALDPDRFFVTSEDLDFTFVAVSATSNTGVPLAGYGYHPLIAGEGKILIGHGVTVVQHPLGGSKSVTVHNSRLMYLTNDNPAYDRHCYYTSETDEGSSGAPVFNTRWEVIALHHASVPKRNAAGQIVDGADNAITEDEAKASPSKIVWIANEGIRVSRLVAALKDAPVSVAHAAIRDDLLALWSKPVSAPTIGNESVHTSPSTAVARSSNGASITVPINITLEVAARTKPKPPKAKPAKRKQRPAR